MVDVDLKKMQSVYMVGKVKEVESGGRLFFRAYQNGTQLLP